DRVAVVQQLGVEAVGPVLSTLAGDVRGGAGGGGQLSGAGEEVGVDVGLGHRGDGHPVVGGKVQVDLDVAPRIHHQRHALGLAADEVAGLGQVLVIDAFEKHRSSWKKWCAVLRFRYPRGYQVPRGVCNVGVERWSLWRILAATTTPDAAVRAATIRIAASRPRASAVMPETRAPAAKPPSRQSRQTPTGRARQDGWATSPMPASRVG